MNEREAIARWRTSVPALVAALGREWELRVDGTAMAGQAAAVVPVRTSTGKAAVLKVGWPHAEAEHEHLALRAWAGAGTVQLLRADPRRFALLLERAEPGHDLKPCRSWRPARSWPDCMPGCVARRSRS